MAKKSFIRILFNTLRNYNNFILINTNFILRKKVIYSNIPECAQKVYLTGKGNICIGNNCTFGFKMGGFHKGGYIEIQARRESAHIKIGNNISTNNNIFFCAANEIIIEDNTIIGQNVTFLDHDAHGIKPDERRTSIGELGIIRIERNVWIGNNVTILKNVTIGANSIIATGAVVTRPFPENVIIGGVPAKIIGNI